MTVTLGTVCPHCGAKWHDPRFTLEQPDGTFRNLANALDVKFCKACEEHQAGERIPIRIYWIDGTSTTTTIEKSAIKAIVHWNRVTKPGGPSIIFDPPSSYHAALAFIEQRPGCIVYNEIPW